jgi:hypothetical protein
MAAKNAHWYSGIRRLARGVAGIGAVISQLVVITIDALNGRYDA